MGLCGMWENVNCLQVLRVGGLGWIPGSSIEKVHCTIKKGEESLKEALSFKPILPVPNLIIYHWGFPFPRLNLSNKKTPLRECFLSSVGRRVQKETDLVWCSTNQYLLKIKKKKAFWSVWECLQCLPLRWLIISTSVSQPHQKVYTASNTFYVNRIILTRI